MQDRAEYYKSHSGVSTGFFSTTKTHTRTHGHNTHLRKLSLEKMRFSASWLGGGRAPPPAKPPPLLLLLLSGGPTACNSALPVCKARAWPALRAVLCVEAAAGVKAACVVAARWANRLMPGPKKKEGVCVLCATEAAAVSAAVADTDSVVVTDADAAARSCRPLLRLRLRALVLRFFTELSSSSSPLTPLLLLLACREVCVCVCMQ